MSVMRADPESWYRQFELPRSLRRDAIFGPKKKHRSSIVATDGSQALDPIGPGESLRDRAPQDARCDVYTVAIAENRVCLAHRGGESSIRLGELHGVGICVEDGLCGAGAERVFHQAQH